MFLGYPPLHKLKNLSASTVRAIRAITAAISTSVLVALPVIANQANSNGTLSSEYITMAIQGDLREAKGLFGRSEPHSPTDLELKQEFESRFVSHAVPEVEPLRGQSLIDDLSLAFRTYWRNGLLGSLESTENDNRLFADLGSIRAAYRGASDLSMQANDSFPGDDLDEAGIYYLDTTTPPYRDLFIWREQTKARYRVQLTDVSTPVTVNFMDGFVVQGWKEYASLGLATTTGWVENGELYCVAWAYDTATENFAVSYLKHEARHLVDLQKYPDMQPVELEYRAKLTELAYAHSSMKRILDDFTVKAAENPGSAHAMANWQVTRDMYRKLEGGDIPDDWAGWGYPDVGRHNRVARELLAENTRKNEPLARSRTAVP